MPAEAATAKPPLILIHGFTASPAVWDPVLPLLHEHHTVHAVTLDGHRGGMGFPHGTDPTIRGYADGLERELRALGLDKAHLVGNSLGGWLALELGARGRAETVVYLAPAGGWDEGSWFARLLILQFGAGYLAAQLLRRSPFTRPTLRRLLMAPLVAHPERISADVAVSIVGDMLGCSALVPSLLHPRRVAFGDLGPMSCQVRIAWSGQDRVLAPRFARRRFDQLVPDAEQITIPGVGHVPMSDDPELVAAAILDVTAPGRTRTRR